MYIYDHKPLGPQSLLQERSIISRSAQRNSYPPDRGISGFLGCGGRHSPHVWALEGLGQSTPQDEVKRLMKQLQPLFLKHFSKNRITYGPKVGALVQFRVIVGKDFKAEVAKEGQQLAASILPKSLKFAPEKVLEQLQRFYRALKEPFPSRLRIIDENTKLSREEKAAIFTWLEIMVVEKAKADADKIGAFFSPSRQEIVFRESQIDAGTVAHEMAHVYAEQGWLDLITLMRLRGMEEVHKLDEGMAAYIERTVVLQWHAQQPPNTPIPLAGYDSTYTDRAAEFIKQVGQDPAFEAYFGGWINFTSNSNPEDALIIGKAKKQWKCPWRRTTGYFRRVSTWRQRYV